MAEVLSRLGARKACGLASVMIRDVSLTAGLMNGIAHTEMPLAMRRVLHLKMVTQCAMLEDFGIFLVLADKACLTTRGREHVTHIGLAVTLRLPHRGTCTIVPSKCEHFPDAAEVEW